MPRTRAGTGRWLRAPAVHFACLGTLAFALAGLLGGGDAGVPGPDPIRIDETRIEELRMRFAAISGRRPTPLQEAALIQEAIDEELLYREALALGLDRRDGGIRAWLAQKMDFLSDEPGRSAEELYAQAMELGLDRDDPVLRRFLVKKLELVVRARVGAVEVSEADVREHFERHRERYRQPAMVGLWQVFLDEDRRGRATDADARVLLEQLRAGAVPPEQAAHFGDPHPVGHHYPGRTEADLAKIGGTGFAQQVFALAPGVWAGPVRSAYGLHLVFVEQKEPGHEATLEQVRSRVERSLRFELSEAAMAELLAELRSRTPVVVERRSQARKERRGA